VKRLLRERAALIIRSARQLHNHLAGINAVAEVLRKLGRHPQQAAVLESIVQDVKAVADLVEPRRGNERS
jgi:hypothetical protein